MDLEEKRAKQNEYSRRWRANNREKVREINNRPGAAEKRRAVTDRWRLENAERVRDQARAWRAANPEYGRAWREANAERCSEYARAGAEANPTRRAEKSARYRARMIGAPVVERIDRAAIIARDRQTCHLCGERVPDGEVTLDHIVPLAIGGEHTSRNLAVAHHSCNSAKGTRASNEQLRLVG